MGCSIENDMLRFYVADTGDGIDPQQHDIIFERFRQIDLGPHSEGPNDGMGLGLPIAKAYIESLGGKIWVDSAPGSGSTFSFVIPWNIYNEQLHTYKPVQHLKQSVTSRTILVAEDEEFNYYLIKEILTHKKINVLHAWNGQEAIALVNTHNEIDMVFMDIKMPVLDGYEATKQIKQARPDLPIVALTAYAMLGDREKALLNGCNDYLSKPISMKDMEAIIEKYLS